MRSAVVLFSGGQDSTTCLYLARTLFDRVYALSVYYGQRHAAEIEQARRIAQLAGVPHKIIELPEFGHLVGGATALVRPDVAKGDQPALAGSGGLVDAAMPQGLPTSFVPGRNALLLTLAASYAATLGAKDVVTGVCQTDYSGYPDCREDFVQAMQAALDVAMPTSLRPVRVHAPLMRLTKAETVRLARRLPGAWEGLALSMTCYNGQLPGCGTCPACELRARGFAATGYDPAHAPNPAPRRSLWDTVLCIYVVGTIPRNHGDEVIAVARARLLGAGALFVAVRADLPARAQVGRGTIQERVQLQAEQLHADQTFRIYRFRREPHPPGSTLPAWERCPCCPAFVCSLHPGIHVADRPCPPVDEWPCDPYSEGGPPR